MLDCASPLYSLGGGGAYHTLALAVVNCLMRVGTGLFGILIMELAISKINISNFNLYLLIRPIHSTVEAVRHLFRDNSISAAGPRRRCVMFVSGRRLYLENRFCSSRSMVTRRTVYPFCHDWPTSRSTLL